MLQQTASNAWCGGEEASVELGRKLCDACGRANRRILRGYLRWKKESDDDGDEKIISYPCLSAIMTVHLHLAACEEGKCVYVYGGKENGVACVNFNPVGMD